MIRNVLYHLAMAYGKENQQGESHYYFGLYFKKKEKTESALFHFSGRREALSAGCGPVEGNRQGDRITQGTEKRNTSSGP